MSGAGVQVARTVFSKNNRMTQGGNVAFAATVSVALAPLLWNGRLALNTAAGAALAGLGAAYVVAAVATPWRWRGRGGGGYWAATSRRRP